MDAEADMSMEPRWLNLIIQRENVDPVMEYVKEKEKKKRKERKDGSTWGLHMLLKPEVICECFTFVKWQDKEWKKW